MKKTRNTTRRKRIFCLILSLAMMFSFSISSSASPTQVSYNEDLQYIAAGLIESFVHDPNTALTPGNFTLGSEIPAYFLADGELSDFTKARYFPVFRNNEPVGIFTVHGADTPYPTYTFGADFIDELRGAVLNDNRSFAFVIAEIQIFTVTDTEAIEVFRGGVGSVYIVEGDVVQRSYNEDGPIAVEFSDVEVAARSASAHQIDEYDEATVFSLAAGNIEMLMSEQEQSLDIPSVAPRAWRQVLSPIPQWTQPAGSNQCWAAASWCVGEIVTRRGHTVPQVVAFAGVPFGRGGTVDDMRNVLTGLYRLSDPVLYRAMNCNQHMRFIDNGYPFIMICARVNNPQAMGHAVTAYGYDSSHSPIRIAVMDSLVGSGQSNLRWMTTHGTTYRITSGGITYEYTHALTPVRWRW